VANLFDLVFGCKHRRKTFPLSPVRKKSAAGAIEAAPEMYVVCLDCGKQFLYDWEHMRLGKPADISDGPAAPKTEASKIPFRTKSRLRYVLWGSAISAAVLAGRAANARRQSRKTSAGETDHAQGDGNQNPKTPRTP